MSEENDNDKEIGTNAPVYTHFDIPLDTFVDCVESYRNRNFDEDLKFITEKFEGIDGLCKKIKSDIHNGIQGDDLEKRDQQFGSNRKDPPKRTGI